MEQKLEEFIKEQIDQAMEGLDKEYSKLDFKYEWPDLTDPKKKGAFLKDITAMANTSGPEGFIIFGFDEKQKRFKDANSSDNKLKDESNLQQLLTKHLSHRFELNVRNLILDEKKISVVHIPIAPEPPYFIRHLQYDDKNGREKTEEQRIFIRKGTTNSYATKHDIDEMYRLRGAENNSKEFEAQIEVIDFGIVDVIGSQIFELTFLVENTGSKPFALLSGEVLYSGFKESFGFKNHRCRIGGEFTDSISIVIQTETLKEIGMLFRLPDEKFFQSELHEISFFANFNRQRKEEVSITGVLTNKMFKQDLLKEIRKLPESI